MTLGKGSRTSPEKLKPGRNSQHLPSSFAPESISPLNKPKTASIIWSAWPTAVTKSLMNGTSKSSSCFASRYINDQRLHMHTLVSRKRGEEEERSHVRKKGADNILGTEATVITALQDWETRNRQNRLRGRETGNNPLWIHGEAEEEDKKEMADSAHSPDKVHFCSSWDRKSLVDTRSGTDAVRQRAHRRLALVVSQHAGKQRATLFSTIITRAARHQHPAAFARWVHSINYLLRQQEERPHVCVHRASPACDTERPASSIS